MKTITIYHSPDADDAFMFYGLSVGAVSVPGYQFTHELCDIESLNQRTRRGELDVTAVSVHALAYLKGQYTVLRSGASMGERTYGPRLVMIKPEPLHDGKRRRFAIPGELTSATLAFKLFLHESEIEADLVNVKFDAVEQLVLSGEFDGGIIIHEGQLTAHKQGLSIVMDLGEWWWSRHALPLPLGVNVVKRSLGNEAIAAVGQALRESIQYSLEHRKEALEYALKFGRGISYDEADKFVAMYVNERTLDFGPDGQQSIEMFLREGKDCGIIAELPEIVVV